MDPATSSAQLLFQDSDRQGTFAFGGRQYPVTVLNLPSVVESYKTLDDVNLVKTTDIGQVRLWAADLCSSGQLETSVLLGPLLQPTSPAPHPPQPCRCWWWATPRGWRRRRRGGRRGTG